MAYITRINYTAEQKLEMWERWQRGESLESLVSMFNRPSSSIFGQLSPTGGIRSTVQQRSRLAITLLEREEISRLLATQQSLRIIAKQLRRAASTISR